MNDIAVERRLRAAPVGIWAVAVPLAEDVDDAPLAGIETTGCGGEEDDAEEDEDEGSVLKVITPEGVIVRNMLVSSATMANLEYHSLLSWLVGNRSFALTEMRRARWRSSTNCCWSVGC